MSYIIGPREILKAIKQGNVSSVTVAKNCPSDLVKKIKDTKVEVKNFSGDQKELGIYIGKPFPVAMIGEEKK